MIYTIDNKKIIAVDDAYDFIGMKTFTGVIKDKDNTIVYLLNGKIHREDGPAIEEVNGDKEWLLNGQIYGFDDDYTNESWIRFVKLELLK